MFDMSIKVFSTPFGAVAILWSVFSDRPKITRVLLSTPDVSAINQISMSFRDCPASSCSDIDAVADDIEAFLNGKDIRFSLEVVRMDLCSKFQRKVLRAEHAIPRGSVSTYQRIAGHLDNPNGARAVGNALSNNPFPIIIPCHRVVRSDGSLGGYQGGLSMKRALLTMEGIGFDGVGRIVSPDFYY